MERRQSTLPSARFRQRVSRLPASYPVRNTRSFVSTGEEFPKGSAVFQRTFAAGPNSTGRLAESATPDAFGPRKPDHSAAIARQANVNEPSTQPLVISSY